VGSQKRATFLEEWFGYVTPVYVRVLDPRLGALRYFLMGIILLYVVVYQLLYSGEYVKVEQPVGTVRFSFRSPTEGSCNPLHAGCEMRLRNLTDLPYCGQNPRGDATQVLNCTFWDSQEAVTVSDTHAFLTTYFEEFEQERVCQAEHTSCKHLWGPLGGGGAAVSSPSWKRVFVADVERFTLMLDHAVTATTIGVSGSAKQVQGVIYTKDPALCAAHPNRTSHPVEPGQPLLPTTRPPCYIMPNSTRPGGLGYDIFEMSTLLGAAGIDLDSPKVGEVDHSVRREGVSLVIMIQYSNFRPWKGPTDLVHHEYRVVALGGDAKDISVLAIPPNRRIVYSRHGIQIFVVQSGQLKAFSYLKLLITLTTALTMLAVANFVVDSVGMYVLPEREKFEKVKYPSARIHEPGHRDRLRNHPAYESSNEDEETSDSERQGD